MRKVGCPGDLYARANVRFPPIADVAAKPLPRSVTVFYRTAFWAALIFTLIMALLPHPPQVPGASDKVQHAAAFAALAALGAIGYRSTSALRLFALLTSMGALIEILQAIPALHRDSDVADWLADTVAAGVILAVIYWSRREREVRNS